MMVPFLLLAARTRPAGRGAPCRSEPQSAI